MWGRVTGRGSMWLGPQTRTPLTAPQRPRDAGRTIVFISRILSRNKTHYEVTKVDAHAVLLPGATPAQSRTQQGTRPHGQCSACLSVAEAG